MKATQWSALTVLVILMFSLFGWLVDPILYGPKAVNIPIATSPPELTTVFRPSFDEVEDEILFQNTYRAQGRIWAFKRSADADTSIQIEWVRPSGNAAPSTPWQRLICERAIENKLDKALTLCRKVPLEERPVCLRVLLESLRFQEIPMAIRDAQVNETEEDRRNRHVRLKSEFLNAKCKEIGEVLELARALPANDQKAGALDAVRQAYIAIDDQSGSRDALGEMEKVLDDMTDQGAGWFARLTAATGRVLVWPLLAAIGTAALAVWQQIATHYTKKAIRAAVCDPEIAVALGENLRKCGIILPEDFSKVERELTTRDFEFTGAPKPR